MAQLAMNTRVVALHNSSPISLFFAKKYNGLTNYSDDKNPMRRFRTTWIHCDMNEMGREVVRKKLGFFNDLYGTIYTNRNEICRQTDRQTDTKMQHT
jgi:hypothetical protein